MLARCFGIVLFNYNFEFEESFETYLKNIDVFFTIFVIIFCLCYIYRFEKNGVNGKLRLRINLGWLHLLRASTDWVANRGKINDITHV